MFRVGLTGNVASGKSSVARIWEALGAPVIDADTLARQALAPGSSGLDAVREEFGEDVVGPEGLDRAALRRIVFADAAARKRLEAIVHPEVQRLRTAEEERLRRQDTGIVVHDIPLLFEVGLADEFDMVVLVDAPRELRTERLVRERGLARDEARAMIDAQMPASGKRGRADVVIDNNASLDALETAAETVWAEILRRAGAAASRGPWVRVDMHIHTRSSFDCRSDPEAVVERAVERGLGRICITDHNVIHGALDLADRYPDRVIPGEEVKTAEGVDVIGLFMSEWIPKGTPALETCERIREQGALVYIPHPFAGGKGGGGRVLPEIEGLIDVMEGFNARIHQPSLNERARKWARDRGLPIGAGSDAHTLGEIGNAYVELPPFDHDAASFLAALERGRIHGTESSRLVHLASTFAKLVP
jgi:dephospho-CoA kinase